MTTLDLSVSDIDDVCRYYCAHNVLDESSIGQYQVFCNLIRKWGKYRTAEQLFRREAMFEFRDWVSKGRSPSTVRAKLGIYRALWMFCCDECGHREGPPRGKRINPPIPKRKPEAWTPEEFARILAHCNAAPELTRWKADNWRDLLLTLWYTGARINGLLACKVSDLEGNWLRLPADDDKTLQEHRKELPPDLAQRLLAAPRMHDWLFDWPMSLLTLREHYKEILKAAGLPYGRRELLHKVRRSSATAVAAQSGIEAASRHLGHTSIGMTVANYIDPRQIAGGVSVPAPPVLKGET